MLKGKNIPCQIDEGKSIFAIRSSILIYFYLKALNNHILSSDRLFGLMLCEPFKLDLEDYNKILHEQQTWREDRNNDFISLMEILDGWKNPEKIEQFLNTFNDLKNFVATNPLRSSIIEIINRTGILEYFYKESKNKMENILGIKRIIEVATEFELQDTMRGFSDFVKYLDDCLSDEIDITTDKKSVTENAVQLTTYHGSKGREFEYVYLPNLISRNWENFSMPGEYKLITDEVLDKITAEERKDSELLKLLFVGITRAKHGLTISFADADAGKMQQITKYLVPLSNYDFDSKQFEYNADDFVIEFVRNISRDVYDNKQAFISEITERIKQLKLSPSRLNDYLACPRKFFYTKILGIDIEDKNWDSANFGTLIHSLLEKAVRVAKSTGNYPDIEDIEKDFFNGLLYARFSNQAQKEKVEKLGLETIKNYYPHFIQIPVDIISEIEYSFGGVKVDDNIINGKIDRIEKNSDGTYSLYDYKTGNATSPNQVTIGGFKENYFNQLCFYKYAYEKLTGRKVSNRIIAVGDIHGEYYKLKSLIEKVNPETNDILVFLGDYIDRGFYSKEVVDYLIKLSKSFHCEFLMGNHEYYMLKMLKYNDEFATHFFDSCGGIQALDSYGSKEAILKIHSEFFNNLKPYYLTDKFLFVHAGINPNQELNNQDDIDFYIIRDNFIYRKHKLKQKIIFGHTPFETPYITDDKIGIDTGCGKYPDAKLTAYECNTNEFIYS